MKLNTIQKRNRLNDVSFKSDGLTVGNAYHKYRVVRNADTLSEINFQKGARNKSGSQDGVTNEDLLEIVRHRLQCFQDGTFSCRENAIALTHIEEALMWLNKRTEDRVERNVLGTYEV